MSWPSGYLWWNAFKVKADFAKELKASGSFRWGFSKLACVCRECARGWQVCQSRWEAEASRAPGCSVITDVLRTFTGDLVPTERKWKVIFFPFQNNNQSQSSRPSSALHILQWNSFWSLDKNRHLTNIINTHSPSCHIFISDILSPTSSHSQNPLHPLTFRQTPVWGHFRKTLVEGKHVGFYIVFDFLLKLFCWVK